MFLDRGNSINGREAYLQTTTKSISSDFFLTSHFQIKSVFRGTLYVEYERSGKAASD
jgi:hypothetical protein